MKRTLSSTELKMAAASLTMLAFVGGASQTLAQNTYSGQAGSATPTSVQSPSWRSPDRVSSNIGRDQSLPGSQSFSQSSSQASKPIYWNKSEFLIPFNVGTQGQVPDSVELEVSVDAGRNWNAVERQKVSARQFTFRSNGDGLYWFRIKTIDRDGRSSDASAQPMAIVIDTATPQIDLVVDTNPQAKMVADFRVADANLSQVDMRLEYKTEQDADWIPVQMQSQYGRDTLEVVGKSSWDVPIRARQMVVRLIVRDMAGNENEVTRLPTLMRTANSGTGLKLTSGGSSLFGNIFSSGSENFNPAAAPTLEVGTPPAQTPVRPPNMQAQSPQFAQLPSQAPVNTFGEHSAGELLPTPPAVPRGAPQGVPTMAPAQAPYFGGTSAPATLTIEPSSPSPSSSSQYTFKKIGESSIQIENPNSNVQESKPVDTTNLPPRQPQAYASKSLAFSLDYGVEVDPSNQVSEVELWATVDGGRSWAMWGNDPDKVSPFDVKVQTDGLFGFRMVVVGTNGLANHRPQPGDDADAWIQVDTQMPQARIHSARYGKGPEAGSLVIEYTAQDEFLSDRPITLAYSVNPDGPWTTIESEVPNTGRYLWQGNPNMPRRVFLKIEAYDRAGNVFVDRMELPVDLEGLAPRGRIQGFRPIAQ